jgi:hypothetical protein
MPWRTGDARVGSLGAKWTAQSSPEVGKRRDGLETVTVVYSHKSLDMPYLGLERRRSHVVVCRRGLSIVGVPRKDALIRDVTRAGISIGPGLPDGFGAQQCA